MGDALPMRNARRGNEEEPVSTCEGSIERRRIVVIPVPYLDPLGRDLGSHASGVVEGDDDVEGYMSAQANKQKTQLDRKFECVRGTSWRRCLNTWEPRPPVAPVTAYFTMSIYDADGGTLRSDLGATR